VKAQPIATGRLKSLRLFSTPQLNGDVNSSRKFGTEIPADAETFGSPCEIVDWLERHLSNRPANKQAAAFLKKLAKTHDNPELAEGWKELGNANRSRPLSAKSFGTRDHSSIM
jgi:hypothetical protein